MNEMNNWNDCERMAYWSVDHLPKWWWSGKIVQRNVVQYDTQRNERATYKDHGIFLHLIAGGFSLNYFLHLNRFFNWQGWG